MGQIFDRISRVVRSEINSRNNNRDEPYSGNRAASVIGGAVVGASIGKVGVLAGGTGYSLGSMPLAAAGALTGAALYETLRSLIQGDTSSASPAVIGAVAGAATSATIGGVGVSVGGSAIGVGMAPMAVGGAVVGVGLVGLNRLLNQGISIEKYLDIAIESMEADLQDARQEIINVIGSQKRLQQDYEQAQAKVNKWERLARLALQKGDECLAQEALIRKNTNCKILSDLKAYLNEEPASVQELKRNIAFLAAKISEAKTMRTSLKAQIAAAKLNDQLSVDLEGTSSKMAELERMDEKIQHTEGHSQIVAQLTGNNLSSLLGELDLSSNVDDELENLKQMLNQI